MGGFLEVDLDYLDLHDLHNDSPLAGEKMKAKEEMLSEYQFQIIEDNNFSLGESKILIPNLTMKENISSTIKS